MFICMMSYLKNTNKREEEAARILSELKFTNDDSALDYDYDDDSIIWNGKLYYYHPPKVGDKVNALYNDGKWYVGTIKKIKRPKNTEPQYEIHYQKEKWFLVLSIKNFPQKWHFDE